MSDGVLTRLDVILETRRRDADPSSSYVAQLHSKGLNKILEKVGEECVETIIAAKDCGTENDQSALVSETADLWFHCMVMLSHLGLSSSDVLAELETRFDLSGLVEKASRSSKP